MALSRRSFLRITTAASGAVALGLPWSSTREHAAAGTSARAGVGGAIAVVGAGADTEFGRGAILGMEESDRSAELLRRAPPTVAMPAPGGLALDGWLRELREGEVRALVSALPKESQRELERASVAQGLIAIDARAVHGEAALTGADGGSEAEDTGAGAGAVFRSGVPATAYALVLLRALTAAEPEWRWAMIAEGAGRDGAEQGGGSGAADRRLARLARVALGEARVQPARLLPPDTLLADGLLSREILAGELLAGELTAGQHDALVWVGGRASDRVVEAAAAGRPWVRLDRESSQLHRPVAGLRVALWDPALFRYGAEQLNDRFRRRFGAGMTGEAWAGWMAVKAVGEAVLRTGTGARTRTRTGTGGSGRRELIDRLGGERAAFDGHKGAPLSFRAGSGALAQPLYVVGRGSTRQVDWLMTGATDGN